MAKFTEQQQRNAVGESDVVSPDPVVDSGKSSRRRISLGEKAVMVVGAVGAIALGALARPKSMEATGLEQSSGYICKTNHYHTNAAFFLKWLGLEENTDVFVFYEGDLVYSGYTHFGDGSWSLSPIVGKKGGERKQLHMNGSNKASAYGRGKCTVSNVTNPDNVLIKSKEPGTIVRSPTRGK